MADWTAEKTEVLRAAFHEGLTASQIAERLGLPCTRNAVIGKLHRLGLRRGAVERIARTRRVPVERSRDEPTVLVGVRTPKAGKRKPKAALAPQGLPPIDAGAPYARSNGVSLLALDAAFRMCRWILASDPMRGGQDRYCGQPVAVECSWCPHHRKLAYSTREQVQQRTAKERVACGFDEAGRPIRLGQHGKAGAGDRAFGVNR